MTTDYKEKSSKDMDKNINISELTLEESFAEIENIVNEMSTGDASLEESFEKYKLGMDLLKHCGDKIDKVEKQIQVLNSNDIVIE